MTPTPALSIVSSEFSAPTTHAEGQVFPTALTPAARAKASADQAKLDAAEALESLINTVTQAIAEATEVGALDTLPAATREEIKKFAANSTGSLDLISRAAR